MQQFWRVGSGDVGLHVYWQTLCSPITLILLEFGIQPQASSGLNRGYCERWLDRDVDHNVLSCLIQPSCQHEAKFSFTLFLSSDP